MELLDSRCRVCKEKAWQCGDCQKTDKKQRQAAKRKNTNASPNVPINTDVAEPKNAPKTRPTLRSFLKNTGWLTVRIPRDGHCFFASVAKAFKTFRPDLPRTVRELRASCAKKLAECKYPIPGCNCSQKDGITYVELRGKRGENSTWATIEEYCALIKTNLYGGFEEMTLMTHLYNVRFDVYVDSIFKGIPDGQEFLPQRILREPDYPEDDPLNNGMCMSVSVTRVSFLLIVLFHSGTRIDLLLETIDAGENGITDHFTLLLPKDAEWNYLMKNMPTVDVDYCVADAGPKLGRGLKALRVFHKDDVLGNTVKYLVLYLVILTRNS